MERQFVGRALGLAVAACAMLGWGGVAAAQVSIVTVPVGNPGNAPDTQVMSDGTTGYGAVSYAYNIGKYDVTAGQYMAFLNAVAKTDTFGLYSSYMSTETSYGCGIVQSGTSGNYSYATTKNLNFPVNYVSWGDAARFCNWLQNGQPNAPQGNGTTETGAYTLNGAITDASLLTVSRNPGAVWCIPTENEWYKAAYYNPVNSNYYLYPTQSNSTPSNVLSVTGINNANYFNGISYTDPTNYLTSVGAFAASPSVYDTYDQGGDVKQWNEANISDTYRGLRGGSFNYSGNILQSSYRDIGYPSNAGYGSVGFRVSQVPEPASLGILGIGVIGMLVRRRDGRR
jgi:formylglycine-generating enzyme required for sulfatase activity